MYIFFFKEKFQIFFFDMECIRKNSMKLTYEHVHLIHQNHDSAVKFYKKVLGAKIVDSQIRKGSQQTKLIAGNSLLIVRGIRPKEKPSGSNKTPRLGIDHIGFYVETGGLAKIKESLIQKDILIIEEDDMPHLKYLYCEGPDQIIIEFMEKK
tara:strand:+ start:1156 stop:1611 length:456 start_codon:yes stop_codon:yes gene_type:complete